ncbi:MAG: electron transport complex subunit RsxE [Nitrospirae bacterium RIFCSPLOW2_12_42_9]|nr:MAG: electron transport complex subunit RsxE [Nitrospirae bacterium RIFCSPLOW2_12_42_9]OGW59944.1 MAG: electron transport complex subunit RsxE [Nitrospirae bacterium RIFCSPHIGHO2_02_FULL_42_12]HBI25163.1 electron transport complex subunit RsxE [Nitrospiraceae bacterium]
MAQEITEVQPLAVVPGFDLKEIAGDFLRGLWEEIPLFRLVLGMCPTLAVTTSAINGVGMGIATTFVLVMSNILISILRKIIPDMIRIPAFIIVIATFVTVTDLMMAAFTPELHHSLGIFIPLIVVNCIVLARAEAFASKNNVIRSTADGLGMGIGFTIVLILLGTVREILGNGTWFDMPVLTGIMEAFEYEYQPMIVMILPPGAFIGLGLLVALANKIEERRKGKK